MKKLFLLLVTIFAISVTALAQSQRVTGIVFGEDSGEPLVGATVMGVGTQTGTVTNIDGVFDMLLPESVKKISVSYVGMRTQEFDITPGSQMVFNLVSDNKLDEVIAVAFGTAKKSAFTGAASVVSAEELNKRVATNVADALVGTVPGLQMRGSSGAPGSNDGKINIRGIASLYAETDPLVIVDGSPYTASLSNIPQGDIESISVLKDAASAALYGARGAAGVIIITTKRGNSEHAKVSVDMKWGANTRADQDYDVIDSPAEYYEAGYATLNNYFLSTGQAADRANLLANNNMTRFLGNYNIYNVPDGEQLVGLDGKINPNATLGRTYTATNGQQYYLINDDWTDLAYKTALRQEYNVSVNGGTDKSSFYASVGYLDEGGIIEYSSYKRLSARLKADYQAKPWLKLGANVAYLHSDTESNPNMDQTLGSTNIMYFCNSIAPIFPVFVRGVDANGNPYIMSNEYGQLYDFGVGNRENGFGNLPGNVTLNRPFLANSNPLGANRYNNNSQSGNQFNGTFTADFMLTPWLKANISSNVIWGNTIQSKYDNPYFGPSTNVNGRIQKINTESMRTNNAQTLTYTNSFGEHNVNAMIGHEYYKTTTKYLSATATGGFSPEIQEINAFATKQTSAGYKQAYNVEGYFLSGQYDYAGKYFGSVSYRRDASSRFAKDHRWGNFWSVGGAWIINKDFLQDKAWVNMLKLKASLGQQGNDNIGNWNYINTYDIAPSSPTDMAPSFRNFGNEEITWETTTNLNIGVEFGLFGNRLNGSVDFYNKKTTDLLFWISIPESMGARGYYGNLGDIRNTGVEVQLNGGIIRNKLVSWDINLNFTHNQNRILKLPESKTLDLGGFSQSDASRTVTSWYHEGGSMYELFLPEVAGLTEDGRQLYWMDSDLCTESNGVYTSVTNRPGTKRDLTTTDPNNATRYVQGSCLPKLYGGFSSTLKVGPVDMSVAFDYQIGGKMFDTRYMNYMDPNSGPNGSNWHKDWANSWSATNTSSDIPRWQYGDSYTVYKSNRFLTDASYLNFASFNVGYTLPSFWKEISNLRVYVQGENLCYWSKRKGFDPRYSYTSAASVSAYNPIRNISGGIQVNF